MAKEYIEREALLAEYDRQHTGEPGRARKLIEDAHTIDAVPVRHGRWEHKSSAYDEHIYICKGKDGCGKQISILGNLLSYCPNCGAKMRGEGP